LNYFTLSSRNLTRSLIYIYGTREQRRKIARKPFAHIEKPCSSRMEQCGTNGTMLGTSNLLTPANKFAQLHHQHHHLHRELSPKKRATKKPRLLGARKTLSG
jgi:hypothetical protein